LEIIFYVRDITICTYRNVLRDPIGKKCACLRSEKEGRVLSKVQNKLSNVAGYVYVRKMFLTATFLKVFDWRSRSEAPAQAAPEVPLSNSPSAIFDSINMEQL
jgi:hypothetical protein